MGVTKKRPSKESDPERRPKRSLFILDEAADSDDEGSDYSDYDDYDDEDDETENNRAPAKRARREEQPEKVDKELAQLIKETKEREKHRRPRNIFAHMSLDELAAMAQERFGEGAFDDTEEGEDGWEEGEEGDEEMGIDEYVDELQERNLTLWMVKCRRRRERTLVKKIRQKADALAKRNKFLPIAGCFFQTTVRGFYWVEAGRKPDVIGALRTCRIFCAQRDIQMIPLEKISRCYRPRPVKKPAISQPEAPLLCGTSVRIVSGEHKGWEGLVIDSAPGDWNRITVLCTGNEGMQTLEVMRAQLELHNRPF